MAAGVSSVAMPFLGDQFLWAQQLHRLGCGPPPLDRQYLTDERLVRTIDDLLANAGYRTTARRLGTALAAEAGATRAAAWIEQTIATRRK